MSQKSKKWNQLIRAGMSLTLFISTFACTTFSPTGENTTEDSALEDVNKGIFNSISNSLSDVADKAANAASKATDFAKSAKNAVEDVKSAVQVAVEAAANLTDNLVDNAKTIGQAAKDAGNAAKNVAEQVEKTANNAKDSLSNKISESLNNELQSAVDEAKAAAQNAKDLGNAAIDAGNAALNVTEATAEDLGNAAVDAALKASEASDSALTAAEAAAAKALEASEALAVVLATETIQELSPIANVASVISKDLVGVSKELAEDFVEYANLNIQGLLSLNSLCQKFEEKILDNIIIPPGSPKDLFNPMSSCAPSLQDRGLWLFGREGGGGLPIYQQTAYMTFRTKDTREFKLKMLEERINLLEPDSDVSAIKQLIASNPSLLAAATIYELSTSEDLSEVIGDLFDKFGDFAITGAYNMRTNKTFLLLHHRDGNSGDLANNPIIKKIESILKVASPIGAVEIKSGKEITFKMDSNFGNVFVFFYFLGTQKVEFKKT